MIVWNKTNKCYLSFLFWILRHSRGFLVTMTTTVAMLDLQKRREKKSTGAKERWLCQDINLWNERNNKVISKLKVQLFKETRRRAGGNSSKTTRKGSNGANITNRETKSNDPFFPVQDWETKRWEHRGTWGGEFRKWIRGRGGGRGGDRRGEGAGEGVSGGAVQEDCHHHDIHHCRLLLHVPPNFLRPSQVRLLKSVSNTF